MKRKRSSATTGRGRSRRPTAAARKSEVEHEQRFSRSRLWQWQREYFAARSVAAWANDEVPHYVTNSVVLAQAYAEMIFAARRDFAREFPATGDRTTIVELGAGCGRLAFHVLTRLSELCVALAVPVTAFRYVLTDANETLCEFWRAHPQLAPFVECGMLDVARYDIAAPGPLPLQVSGETLAPASIDRPIVVIANYAFDSVPQELYYLKDGEARPCSVSLSFPGAIPEDAAERLAKVELAITPAAKGTSDDLVPWLKPIPAAYAAELDDRYLLFPATALECLNWLSAIAPRGVILLAADKGGHQVDDIVSQQPPNLVRHGSFSLDVNFHAIAGVCRRCGGVALVPPHRHASVSVICFAIVEAGERYVETRLAYDRWVSEFGPDDSHQVLRHGRGALPHLPVAGLLGHLRLSRYDPQEFERIVPMLRRSVRNATAKEREAVHDAMERIWARHYFIQGRTSIANEIGVVLCELGNYAAALPYFERAIADYGVQEYFTRNLVACLRALGRTADAQALIERFPTAAESHPEPVAAAG